MIAQDTTAYGRDLYGRPSLARLLRELAGVEGIDWIRVMYTYPSLIDNELIDVLAGEERIVKYLDIPMQHGSDKVLQMMSRQSSREFRTASFGMNTAAPSDRSTTGCRPA